MFSLLILALCASLGLGKNVVREKRSTKCYQELGCFSTGGLFFSLHRPINFLPQSRQKVNTQFLLYTRNNPTTYQSLKVQSQKNFVESHFSSLRPTKIISHGFLQNGFVDWMKHMKDEFLKKGDFNVILIDWGGGSPPPYTQATANTRLVGAEIALMVNFLLNRTGADPRDFHIIGHSLGAHIAGYAGERIKNLGRITGLDPAGPYFENTDPAVRLDATDALFVDNIHTDGINLLHLGYGMNQPCGHVDYYPNSGKNQPGCDKDPVSLLILDGLVKGVTQFVACNHLRSYEYFSESINSDCPFRGYACADYESFLAGKCVPCVGTKCGQMGLKADQYKPTNGQTNVKYFFKTADSAPYCRYNYQIQLTFGNPLGSRNEHGFLYITLVGHNAQTGKIKLTENNILIEGGKSYSFIIIYPKELGKIKSANFEWKHQSSLLKPWEWNPFGLRHPKVYVRKISVTESTVAMQSKFCAGDRVVESEKNAIFYSNKNCS